MDFTAPTTLYKATKTLMKASQGAPITLAGMGLLTPTSPLGTSSMFLWPTFKRVHRLVLGLLQEFFSGNLLGVA